MRGPKYYTHTKFEDATASVGDAPRLRAPDNNCRSGFRHPSFRFRDLPGFDGGTRITSWGFYVKKLWQRLGMCPNCSVNLSESVKTRPPYDKCPFCSTPIQPIWWQRTTVVLLALLLAFTVPSWLGVAGWDVYFAGLFLCWPALLCAHILFFATVPPKYVRREQTFTTLFHGNH